MEKSAVKSRKRMSWEVGLTMSFWLTAQSCDSVFSVAWQLHVITKKLILSWNRLDMVIYVGRYSCSGKTILFLVSVSVSRFHMMNCSTSSAGCILPKKVKSDSALERGCAEKKNKTKKPPPCYSSDQLLLSTRTFLPVVVTKASFHICVDLVQIREMEFDHYHLYRHIP